MLKLRPKQMLKLRPKRRPKLRPRKWNSYLVGRGWIRAERGMWLFNKQKMEDAPHVRCLRAEAIASQSPLEWGRRHDGTEE